MNMNKLTDYLTDDIIDKMSFHVCRDNNGEGVCEDVCLLEDGTLITISTVKNGIIAPENFLYNPNNISIRCESMVIVKFKDSEEDKYKQVRFRVSSINDLETQWKKYREVKNLGDIYGTIYDISMTSEQMKTCSELMNLSNRILNIITKEDIPLFFDKSDKGINRANMVSGLIPAIASMMLQEGSVDSVYCPTLIKDYDSGKVLSVVDTIDMNFLLENEKRKKEYMRKCREEDGYFFDEDDDEEYEEDEYYE